MAKVAKSVKTNEATVATVATAGEAVINTANPIRSGRVTKSFEEKIADTAKATAARKRFSFGPVWNEAVIAGTVTDHAKLVEQAVKLKINARSDAKRLKFDTLRLKVAAALIKRQQEAKATADAAAATETAA